MIDAALAHIAQQLNQSLRRAYLVAEDLVVVSSLHECDGGLATGTANRLALFLVNLQRDTVGGVTPRASSQTRHLVQPAPVHLNLMLMVAANFGGSTYQEGLKLLSSTLAFFQSRPLFDHHNTPELDRRIERLVLDLENLDYSQLSQVWGLFGGRYLPSVVYRLRLITIDAGHSQGTVPSVQAPTVRIGSPT
ncbi:DUF4255 domain-containing protein [Roseateles terrae]|uniref:Pvc16 N-terminal domain-containing protein n=1 Tax=Roseateles terrae TaxID=431060 RepID=A0ABR6GPN0_9BURK|nr:DUF4255 domain-containing protein [Roseateles terrae]MBB3193199.1 hypothetical protein [Roseateles terrae]OWQ89583.1 hypothetical protein CDN98_03400 [Roseateles terrae]